MSTGSLVDMNGYLQQEFHVNDKLLKAAFGPMEGCDVPGVYRYWRTPHPLKTIINKHQWVFTKKTTMSCKKVSIVVHRRRGTAVIWDGQEPPLGLFSSVSTMEQKP